MEVLAVQELSNKEKQYIIVGIEDGWLKANKKILNIYYKLKEQNFILMTYQEILKWHKK